MARRRFSGLVAALAAAASLAACSGADEATDDSDLSSKEGAAQMFGNDRVGRMLKDHPEKAPRSFEEFEALFKVGRQCPRTDSKEIFVVEEATSREGGEQQQMKQPLPRAVVTGCNTDPSNPEAVKTSYSLLAALISTTDKTFAPNADKGDTIVMTPLEVMAFDETTGVYNFYKFFSNGNDKPATILRVERAADGEVFDNILEPGKKPVRQPAVRDGQPTKRCFDCHVSGGPLMNEIHDPWTNWVSFRANHVDVSKLSGQTLELVNEAVPNATTNRSSLAKQLEDTLMAGMRAYVMGTGEKPAGYGRALASGAAPGGSKQALKSVFCQTDVNYASALDTVPLELFFDASLLTAAGAQRPGVVASDVFPKLLPVRSEMDKRIEQFLIKNGYLTARTAIAARLVDEQRDIFSDARCKLLDDLGTLPAAPPEVDAQVRKVLTKAASALPAGPRKTYMQKLLDPAVTDDALAPARDAYNADLSKRFDAATKQLGTTTGRSKLKGLDLSLKAAARKQFPGRSNPLPEEVLRQGLKVAGSSPSPKGLEMAKQASDDDETDPFQRDFDFEKPKTK
jgi:hypothetical protein